MERLLALELIRVTEAAAIASARLMGRGDTMTPTGVAVEAMRRTFDEIPIDAPDRHRRGRARRGPDALHRRARRRSDDGGGEAPEIDIAVDPLEGTNLVATGQAERDHRPRGNRARRAPKRPRLLHGEALRRPGGGREGGHHGAAGREPAPDRRGPGPRRQRHHGRHPGSPPPRGADRGGPRGRRPDQADQRRRPLGGDRWPSRAPASTP